MTTAILTPTLTFKSWLSNGTPNAFGTVATYQAGTTTPIATYTDYTAGTPNTNPIVLNARGEANIWVLPNVAYKFVQLDSVGNLIPGGTIDQVTQAQLLTLYGGVDTGTVNAYVVTFTSNFSAYADGIVLYFVPSNSNSGASTINVNGLGVVAIKNVDGSTLLGGQIIAGHMITIIYKGGVFEFMSPPMETGTVTPVWTGFSANPTMTISYRKVGTDVTLTFIATGLGTSNATNLFFTGLPAIILPSFTQWIPIAPLSDNGATLKPSGVAIIDGTGKVLIQQDSQGTAWTASGTKGLAASNSIKYVL